MSNCEEKDSKIETFESRVNKQKKNSSDSNVIRRLKIVCEILVTMTVYVSL